MQRVLGLIGRKGAGKDTAAKVLLSAGWVRLAFADPLYKESAEAFGVTVDFLANRDTKETPLPELALYKCRDQVFVAVVLQQAGIQLGVTEGRMVHAFLQEPRSPRQIMQFWGTEYKRRVVRDDYWIEKVRAVINANPDTNFVIPDVRFPNEALLVTKEFGGELARVIRPSLENVKDVGMKHDSEIRMRDYPVDVILVNEEGEKGIEDLAGAVVDRILREFNETSPAAA